MHFLARTDFSASNHLQQFAESITLIFANPNSTENQVKNSADRCNSEVIALCKKSTMEGKKAVPGAASRGNTGAGSAMARWKDEERRGKGEVRRAKGEG